MVDSLVTSTTIERLSNLLKVLANPKRLKIMNLLMEGVQCNCELGDSLELPPNLISHHMGILREAGLVDIERDPVDARWIYFSVNREALQVLNEAFEGFFDPDRIQPRQPVCGPGAEVIKTIDLDPGAKRRNRKPSHN